MITKIAAPLILIAIVCLAGCGGGPDSTPMKDAPAKDAAARSAADASTSDSPSPGGATVTGTSSVVGKIIFEGAVPKLPALKMNADPGCEKKHTGPVPSEVLVLGDGNTLANVMVSVKGGLPTGTHAHPTDAVVLDQRGCRYTPHVIGVMVGQPFNVLNSDGLLHNVHALPKVNKQFNRAMPAGVTKSQYTFDRPEPMFKIKCDVHPWMGAFVGVFDHPYFSVSGTDGVFRIEGLPAGTYEIEAWHERLGTQTASVTVAENAAETLDFSFTR